MNQYLTVSKLNEYIRILFDRTEFFKKVYLKGEISNFKHHSSGHLYLTLKDEESRISAIMFRSSAMKLNFTPKDGMNVLVSGRVSVYPAGGNYQIYIDSMEQDGLGNLYIEYEKLKKKLLAEGLFDKEKKKTIPKYPLKIGVVTAPTGAAIKDITSTIRRRFPLAQVILFPALVQGASAAPDIVKKIELAGDYDLDVLIIGRGGGSIEDLWAFNEEIVARAIYNCKIPTISAVGHEVDFTIADFVADLRAPTPTGAAEIAVPTLEEVKNIFQKERVQLASALNSILEAARHQLKKYQENYLLKNPMTLYEIKIQRLDTLTTELQQAMKHLLKEKYQDILLLKSQPILKNPLGVYREKEQFLQSEFLLLNKEMTQILTKKKQDLVYIIQTVKLLNPLNILDKGYSVVKKGQHVIKDIKDVENQDELEVILSKGKLKVEVKERLE